MGGVVGVGVSVGIGVIVGVVVSVGIGVMVGVGVSVGIGVIVGVGVLRGGKPPQPVSNITRMLKRSQVCVFMVNSFLDTNRWR